MQRTFFIGFISHHSGCLFLFCRVMWIIIIIIIINVNPNMMHIFFFNVWVCFIYCFLLWGGGVMYPETSSYRNIFLLLTIMMGGGVSRYRISL